MLHCYKGDDFINVEGGYNYWGNCCGDIFNPFTKANLEVDELPEQLKTAYTALWVDGAGARCYPVQFQNKYGIALELEYEDDWIEETEIANSHEELIEFARKKAEGYAEKYPEYDVIFGEDSLEWYTAGWGSDFNTIVSIFIPWNAKPEEVRSVANELYETGYTK